MTKPGLRSFKDSGTSVKDARCKLSSPQFQSRLGANTRKETTCLSWWEKRAHVTAAAFPAQPTTNSIHSVCTSPPSDKVSADAGGEARYFTFSLAWLAKNIGRILFG